MNEGTGILSIHRCPLFLLWAAALVSCGVGEARAGLEPEPLGGSIVITADHAQVAVGELVELTAAAFDASGKPIPAVVDWFTQVGVLTTTSDSSAEYSSAAPGTFFVYARGRTEAASSDSIQISVLAPPSPVVAFSISPDSVSVLSGAVIDFKPTATRQDGSTFVPSVVWASTGGTIDNSGRYVAGITAGVFRVIATYQGNAMADTSIVVIAVPPPPGPNPNEPVGYTEIASQPFSALSANGWSSNGTASIEVDVAAPVSPNGVVRVTYPSGYRAGDAPWSSSRGLSSRAPQSLYYRIAFKHSLNFQGNGSATNKLGYVWIHGNPSVFLSAEGSGSGNLIAQFRLQNVPDSRGRLIPNRGSSGVISRGVWHSWEVQIISNTPGVPNGIARWWLDGVLVGEYTDVLFASSSQSNIWQTVSIYPIWGGVGGTVSSPMTLDFDNIYVSAPE